MNNHLFVILKYVVSLMLLFWGNICCIGVNISTSSVNLFLETPKQVISEPGVQADNFDAVILSDNEVQLSWTCGNGKMRIVLARKNKPVEQKPQDGSKYFASTEFGKGSLMDENQYVVYYGNSNNIKISNLNTGIYYFEIFECNVNENLVDYKESNPGKTKINIESLPISSIDPSTFHITKAIEIYPNPGQGIFNVKQHFSNEAAALLILNQIGETVFHKQLMPSSFSTAEIIDLSGFSKGFYFFIVKSKSTESVDKVVFY